MAVDLWETGVKVLVVYPGVVDTDLFRLPDNDPVLASVEPVPVQDLVDGVLNAMDAGAMQVYVPEWFGPLVATKAADPAAFLAGTAAYVRDQQAT